MAGMTSTEIEEVCGHDLDLVTYQTDPVSYFIASLSQEVLTKSRKSRIAFENFSYHHKAGR
jgi:hypothetical protein